MCPLPPLIRTEPTVIPLERSPHTFLLRDQTVFIFFPDRTTTGREPLDTHTRDVRWWRPSHHPQLDSNLHPPPYTNPQLLYLTLAPTKPPQRPGRGSNQQSSILTSSLSIELSIFFLLFKRKSSVTNLLTSACEERRHNGPARCQSRNPTQDRSRPPRYQTKPRLDFNLTDTVLVFADLPTSSSSPTYTHISRLKKNHRPDSGSNLQSKQRSSAVLFHDPPIILFFSSEMKKPPTWNHAPMKRKKLSQASLIPQNRSYVQQLGKQERSVSTTPTTLRLKYL